MEVNLILGVMFIVYGQPYNLQRGKADRNLNFALQF